MRVLSWNCRGLGNPFAVLQCQKKAKEYSPNILFLMETKLDIGKRLDVLRKCDFLNGWEVPREGLSRGLLLGWSPEQKLTIQYSSRHMIHSEILDHKGTPLSITFIYGQPDHTKREEVWIELKHLRHIARTNWLCIGDFNQILSHDDKFAFDSKKIIGSDLFQQILSELELCELEAKGKKYTWMNQRENESFVMEKLDRAFAIVDWINSCPQYTLHNHPIIRSDHGAILLNLENKHPFRRSPFKFEKMWVNHNECQHVVQNA